MPSPSSRWHRVLAVVTALTAVLAGALLCAGTGTAAETGGTAEHGGPQTGTAPRAAAAMRPAATELPAVAAPADDRPVPGCGEGSGDGGPSPATPPRGSAAHELLPALPTTAHGTAGCPAAGGALLDPAPGRAPPALAAPGPIDLSVLRV
ncbi:hypothetical protein [Streptomyces sp. NPDC096153]|uniref:hypothetical protein n=1 Tax=Streptomyces sp. NPDC096153 TaxID=3155548 RepID=UPI003322C19C